MKKRVLIVGGGTAGWMTAGYLAEMLEAAHPGGVEIRLVESPEIPIIGVGEGTIPTIQRTLRRIGIDEARLVRECNATFKQGIEFRGWEHNPGEGGRNGYFHPFELLDGQEGPDLVPYWVLGHAGANIPIDVALSVQKPVADATLAPKTLRDAGFGGPLNYAYHFDATKLATLLREAARQKGVGHIVDTVKQVQLDETGAIAALVTDAHGPLTADLYIDCSGFHSRLIGTAMGVPFISVRDKLFNNRAMAMQVPYPGPDTPIASATIATAREAGWIWDIGLDHRRGVGYVYSSDHTDDARAEQVVRQYVGADFDAVAARPIRFETGYRERHWVRNCVAVGLAGGFLEPLEAPAIGLVEVAAVLIANLFPWGGPVEAPSQLFNHIMTQRYRQLVDFLKVHYCLTKRTDSAYWRDHADPATSPDSLKDLLDGWRFRVPDEIDREFIFETFGTGNWQFVVYGMGFKTDLTARAGIYRHHEIARQKFARLRERAEAHASTLPSHRSMIAELHRGTGDTGIATR